MVCVEDERGDALGARRVRIGAGEEQERRGVLAVRDPLLGARDRPAVAVRIRLRARRAGVGTGLRLGQGESADALAACERRDEARPLLVGPEARLEACKRWVCTAPTPASARGLLEDEDVGEEVSAGAAVLLRDADAHRPEEPASFS